MKHLAKFHFFILLALGIFLLIAWLTLLGIRLPNQPQNSSTAFWLPHALMNGPSPEWDQLKERLKTAPIDALYFHVGPVDALGELPPLQVPPLAELPTQNLAWMGQIRSQIDLDDATVRAHFVDSALKMKAAGFDGVHIDIEPVRRDDTAFVQLLEELRAKDPDLFISVATDEWQPHWLSQSVARLLDVNIESYWSSEQVRAVAKYTDEIVIMTYDTRLSDPKLYRAWVAIQTSHVSRILPPETRLRIGLPVYVDGPSLNPDAENLKTGLQGYHMGASNILTHHKNLAGIALYPYWEMQEDEWDLLNQYAFDFPKWLKENN